MQLTRVSAVQLVQERHPLVRRRQQGAGAAGEVADLGTSQRLAVAPVRAARRFTYRQRQGSQQGRRLGSCVVGRKKLSVGDEPLKHNAGEVV